MKANCLFCYYLQVKNARRHSGYWSASYGVCWKKEYHIVKNIRNCTLFSQIGPHYQGYLDSLEEYAFRIDEIVKEMNEQKTDWYTESGENKGVGTQ